MRNERRSKEILTENGKITHTIKLFAASDMMIQRVTPNLFLAKFIL